MSVSSYADDLGSAVHYALETTHAIAVCPFHLDLTIRIGDDAAESHAFARARKLVKSDGTTWEGEALRKEFGRQLGNAADRYCPQCALLDDPELNRNLPARAAVISLRLRRRSRRTMSDTPLGEIVDMSDRTKYVLIMVVVVCLAIVVADLWIGVGPD